MIKSRAESTYQSFIKSIKLINFKKFKKVLDKIKQLWYDDYSQ